MSRAKAERKRANQPKRLDEFKRFVPTPDDWSPTIVNASGERGVDGKVFLDDYPGDEKRYFLRICFWGGDDTGRDFDFATNDLKEAKREFEKWCQWLAEQREVTFARLLELGFTNG